jgi:hypothetical protein
MSVPLRRRISCSLDAAGIAWLISGVVFAVVIKGPGTISAWLIWGTFFFLSGWMLVGLPIIALGDKILRMSRLLVMIVAGTGGAAVMLLPIAFTKISATKGGYPWPWYLGDFLWPGVAFSIATPTGWLYRKFLNNESMRLQAPSTAR